MANEVVDPSPSVTPLWTEITLDDAATDAQRRALLTELAAEQFESGLPAHRRRNRLELAAARHLARAAHLAREAAELERGRCATAYGKPGAAGREIA